MNINIESAYRTEVIIRREVRDNLEFFRGIITHENLGKIYEVTRWSETAIRQALTHHLWQIKLSILAGAGDK